VRLTRKPVIVLGNCNYWKAAAETIYTNIVHIMHTYINTIYIPVHFQVLDGENTNVLHVLHWNEPILIILYYVIGL
jgi:hypothetical protein